MQRPLTDFEKACQYVRERNAPALLLLLGIPDYLCHFPNLLSIDEEPLIIKQLPVYDRSINHLNCEGENLFTYFAKNAEHDAVHFLFYTLRKPFYESISEFECELGYVAAIMLGYYDSGQMSFAMQWMNKYSSQWHSELIDLMSAMHCLPRSSSRSLQSIITTIDEYPGNDKVEYIIDMLYTMNRNGLIDPANELLFRYYSYLSANMHMPQVGENILNAISCGGWLSCTFDKNPPVIFIATHFANAVGKIETFNNFIIAYQHVTIDEKFALLLHPIYRLGLPAAIKARERIAKFHAPFSVVNIINNGLQPDLSNISRQYASRCQRLDINTDQALALSYELVILLLQPGTPLIRDVMLLIACQFSNLSLQDTTTLAEKLISQRTQKFGLFTPSAKSPSLSLTNPCRLM